MTKIEYVYYHRVHCTRDVSRTRVCTWVYLNARAHARTHAHTTTHSATCWNERHCVRRRKAATLPLSFKQLFVAVFWAFVKWNASKREVARRRRWGRRNPWRDRSGKSLDRCIFTINSRAFLRLIRS